MFRRGGTENCSGEVCITFISSTILAIFGDGGDKLIGINKKGEKHLGGLLMEAIKIPSYLYNLYIFSLIFILPCQPELAEFAVEGFVIHSHQFCNI